MKRTKYNPTEEQKTEAAARREALRKIARMVSEMSPAQRDALVSKIGAVPNCEGRALSIYNSCFLISQNPAVSMVGGFRQWRKVGRKVCKGSRALAIWLPLGTDETEPGESVSLSVSDTEETAEEGGKSRARFRLVWVFDVSQTIGIEETEPETGGDVLALDTVRHTSGRVVEPLALA